jgi:hypothetical protein
VDPEPGGTVVRAQRFQRAHDRRSLVNHTEAVEAATRYA